MGRPNKGSSLTEKAFDNYSSSDYLAGFENGGSTHKYNIANVSKYALEKQTLSAGGKSGTVKSIIDGLTPRIKKTEDDIAAFETTVAQAEAAVTELSGRVNAMESGPLVAATSSAMVDTTRIYVYTGEELGMTSGDWYYHNGTNWVSGGPYNAVAVNTDDTLSVEDVPADAKAVGDAFEEMDEQKANVDGVYESMTVGNAEQLIGSVFTEDSTPYNFRTAGGSIDIGDREIDKLVGGTVAWNQWIRNGNFANTDNWIAFGATPSISVSNNILTFTVANASEGVRCTGLRTSFPTGHKVLNTIDILSTSNEIMFRVSGSFAIARHNSGLSSWETISVIGVADGDSYMFLVRDDRTSDFDAVSIRNAMMIDLTQMFGSAIADYIYNLEQTTEGAGVAFFRKLFPKPYYPYNAGELMSVKATSHKTVGFNAFDRSNITTGYFINGNGTEAANADWAISDYIKVAPGSTYYYSVEWYPGVNAVVYYDADKHIISFGAQTNHLYTIPAGCCYVRLNMKLVDSYEAVFNLSWDGERDGEYEEYKEHVYPLDSNLTLRGIPKLDASNKLYYDGDTYESDGTVKRKYGVVDLGTCDFTYSDSYTRFVITNLSSVIRKRNAILMCSSRYVGSMSPIEQSQIDKTICVYGLNGNIYINDFDYTDADTLKAALSGVYMVYELAEPTEETAAPYQNPQVVDDFGTEEYVDSRTVQIPVGHETKYANNLRAKLEMAPDSPDGNGDYIVRHTNGENEYTPLVIPKELPNTPSEDGIYHLKVTVVNGAAGLSWESEA